MYRSVEITVDPVGTDKLLEELEKLEDVVGLSVVRGGSIKPPGDVLTVHALNRGVDDVWKLAEAAQAHGSISIATGELISIVSPDEQSKIESDLDESVWEEMEANLRHQGQITVNYMLLMALGGGVAAAGFVMEHVNQAITLVAASVIAPGFEPIAMIALGTALRRWHIVRRGLASTAAGYLSLMLGAAAIFGILRLAGHAGATHFLESPEVRQIAHPTMVDVVVSACAALAGVVMMTAYRRHVIAGPLVALKVIPAAAMIGAALTSGQFRFIDQGLKRWALDAAFILTLGILYVLFKQVTVHRRGMMA